MSWMREHLLSQELTAGGEASTIDHEKRTTIDPHLLLLYSDTSIASRLVPPADHVGAQS